MSADEMREYCTSLSSFQVRVQIRLKAGQELVIGRIGRVAADHFQIVSEGNVVQSLNYSWVAKIANC